MKALYPSYLAATALLITPLVAQATIFQFNAGLNLANEIPTPIMPQTMPTGVATLFYDDKGTPSLADDRYDFALSAFELSGTAAAFHIHGAATTTETAPVRVALDNPMLFTNFKDGGTLLVGGNDVVPIDIPATPATATNAGHPASSFLAMLQAQLAYVNIHTALNPAGEIRGQLIEVTPIPEPGTYAMLLAGLGLLGFMARRRMR